MPETLVKKILVELALSPELDKQIHFHFSIINFLYFYARTFLEIFHRNSLLLAEIYLTTCDLKPVQSLTTYCLTIFLIGAFFMLLQQLKLTNKL